MRSEHRQRAALALPPCQARLKCGRRRAAARRRTAHAPGPVATDYNSCAQTAGNACSGMCTAGTGAGAREGNHTQKHRFAAGVSAPPAFPRSLADELIPPPLAAPCTHAHCCYGTAEAPGLCPALHSRLAAWCQGGRSHALRRSGVVPSEVREKKEILEGRLDFPTAPTTLPAL